jgi:hypothetical protein
MNEQDKIIIHTDSKNLSLVEISKIVSSGEKSPLQGIKNRISKKIIDIEEYVSTAFDILKNSGFVDKEIRPTIERVKASIYFFQDEIFLKVGNFKLDLHGPSKEKDQEYIALFNLS